MIDEELRKGIELFNRRAYFESHEVWEEIWRSSGEPEKKFLQALIKMAAGLHLRFHRGAGRGARNLLVQALLSLENYRPTCLGVDVDRLCAELSTFAERVEEQKEKEAGWLDRWLAPRIRMR